MVERLWCEVCNHGVDGVVGNTCPECAGKRRGEGCGVLKTPEQAEKDYLERAKAIKLARSSDKIRGQKTTSERLADMKKSIMDEIRSEFNLVPKGQAVEAKAVSAVDTTQEAPKTVAEYRKLKKSTKK